MTQGNRYGLRSSLIVGLAAAALVAPGVASGAPPREQAAPAPSPSATPKPAAKASTPKVAVPAAPATGAAATADTTTAPPLVQPLPVAEPVMAWKRSDAQALLTVIEGIEAEGLIPADYQPDKLRAAIEGGEGDNLNQVASKSFNWLAEDLRDGRTPMTARVQWFAVDPDQDVMTNTVLLEQAVETHDVPGVLASLAPTHPDYAMLKAELANTPKTAKAKRAQIRANMDRWRWLARDLGPVYLLTNVPEYQLRLAVNHENIRTYRTIVGKPGKTATPQLAETVTAVVFNPTWTVPQSIVKGEGLGARLVGNPASARRQGYAVSRSEGGTITVVQQPGPNNALGLMKIDMPNPHAIYLHDTPTKGLFNTNVRAYSHGCIRTERAVELGMTMAMLGAEVTPEQAVASSTSGKYTKVPMTKTFPVYITYFTMGRNIDGAVSTFADIYGRDAPVLASFAKPRQLKTTQRTSDEEIIKLDNPL
ncbi:MAG: L,D-transpeptidase family protein [Novosphingobium sp.]